MTRYRTIVADPPWDQKAGPKFTPGLAKSGKHYTRESAASRLLEYPTMDVDDIAALPVADMAEGDAHLYLWVTNKYIEDGFAICRAWGFRFSTMLTWAKAPRGIGLGGTFCQTTEHVIFGRRGTLSARTRVDSTWWGWKRQDSAHSAKPEAFLDLVEQVSPGPYLELFARRQRLGWDTWGNEALCHVDLTGEAA